MTLEVMCLYAQPPRGLWLQMLCTEPHPRSHSVLSGYITLPNASFAIRHGPLSPCCQNWDSLPHCSFVPAVHSAGRRLQGRRLLRLQTPSGRFDFRIREPFSLPRKCHPEYFLFSFYFVFKCCQSEFHFKSPSYFGNTEGTKVFLNVYDRGTSQSEIKRMCIKIFPLGKEHKSQSSTRGEFLLPSYIHLSGQGLATRCLIPSDLTEAAAGSLAGSQDTVIFHVCF